MWSRIGSAGLRGPIPGRSPPWRRLCTAGEAAPRSFAALWGNGDHGRLGLSGVDSRWRPSPLPPSAFHGHGLRSLACGGAHTLFLTETGCVYATGLNDYGQLGLSTDTPFATVPMRVSGLPEEIVQISAGYYHSSAITADGELYMWGNNSKGQLGLGKGASKAVYVPTKVESLIGMGIKNAALGSEHTIAVTDGGEALSWGEGGYGRLGHGRNASFFGFFRSTSEHTPRLIKELEGVKVKNVAASLLHSACVDENGSVFIFGERPADKLGFRDSNSDSIPVITELPCSEEVACGGSHTCALTSSGELYSWGSNENGCLGICTTTACHQPERVQGPFSTSVVSQVSCGWKHTAAVSEGRIFTWGWGGSYGMFFVEGESSGGQLGHGSDVDYRKPMMINLGKNIRALQVSCGFNHTGAILEHI